MTLSPAFSDFFKPFYSSNTYVPPVDLSEQGLGVCSIASKAEDLYKAIFADQPQSTKTICAAVELLGAMLATKGGKALFVLGVLSFLPTSSYLTFIIPFGYVAYKANLGGKAMLGLLAAWFFAPITTLVGTAYVGYKLYQQGSQDSGSQDPKIDINYVAI